MTIAFLLGRILFGGFFLLSGVNHFSKRGAMVGYAQSKSVPSPVFAVTLTGVMLVLGGLGLILGVYVKTAITLLMIFLVIVSFTMHKFWQVSDPQWKGIEMINFLKNIALIGALLMIWSFGLPWAYALPL